MTPSVHLGFCHTGQVHTDFLLSILNWERYEASVNGRLPAFSATKKVFVAENRNDLVKQFLKHEAQAEWLWTLDPDIIFQPDDLAKLQAVAHPDKAPIVAGAYYLNPEEAEASTTWHAHTDEGLRLFRTVPPVDGGIEIGSCGMGCTLIHRSVFETLQKIYADDPYPWFAHDRMEFDDGPVYAGEDVTFCLRARGAGFTVVGHCGVVVEHLKTMRVPHA